MKRLLSQNLSVPGIAHGFFGRDGGVSEGLYASLNCGPGSKDAPAAVAENRGRVKALLQAEALASLSQVHSAVVHVAPLWESRPEGDALVTATRGVALGILAADCAPVLLADARAGVSLTSTISLGAALTLPTARPARWHDLHILRLHAEHEYACLPC